MTLSRDEILELLRKHGELDDEDVRSAVREYAQARGVSLKRALAKYKAVRRSVQMNQKKAQEAAHRHPSIEVDHLRDALAREQERVRQLSTELAAEKELRLSLERRLRGETERSHALDDDE